MPFWALKNIYSGLFISQSWSNSIQKLLEVDFSTFSLQVRNHVENGWVLWLESQWLHGWFKLARINLASGLSIEEVEGFSELLDFVFSEAWSFYFLLGPCFWDWLSSHSFKQILINFYINYLIPIVTSNSFYLFFKALFVNFDHLSKKLGAKISQNYFKAESFHLCWTDSIADKISYICMKRDQINYS